MFSTIVFSMRTEDIDYLVDTFRARNISFANDDDYYDFFVNHFLVVIGRSFTSDGNVERVLLEDRDNNKLYVYDGDVPVDC